MYKKSLLALALTTVITGCSVTPQAISPDRVINTVKGDLEQLQQSENSAEAPISLEEAIARAVKYNRDKQLEALEAALAQGQLDLVKYEMLPSLTAAAGYTKRSNFAASASVTFEDGEPAPLGADPSYSISQDKERTNYDAVFSWNILDFGLSYVRAKQHADRYLIAKERERKVLHNITQDVRAAYWKAVSAERLLQKIGPLMEQADLALSSSHQVERQQLRSPLEALYYQRELLDIQRALQALRQDLIDAKTELASLMGMKPGTFFELVDVAEPDFTVPELSMAISEMEEVALSQRPELVETYYQQRISAAETRAAMLDMLPGITLNAGTYYDSNDFLLNQDWTSVGARISWNLFDVFKVGAERRLVDTRKALVEQQRLATSMAVLTQVHLSNLRYAQARKSFKLAEHYLDVSQRIGEQTQNAARLQRTSELELIRESLNTLLAELRRDVAYAQLQNSYGSIFASMGLDLLPQNHAGTDVATLSSAIQERLESWLNGDIEASALVVDEATSTETQASNGASVL